MRAGRDEDCGQGFKVIDEQVEFARLDLGGLGEWDVHRGSDASAHNVVGGGSKLVGEQLDRFLCLPTGGGEPAVVANETASAHPVHDCGQLGSGQLGHPAELVRRHGLGQGVQHVQLRPGDALAQGRGDVPVATVLAKQVGTVPEPRQRFRRYGQRPHGGVESPSIRPSARPGPGEKVSSTGNVRRVGEVAQDPPQRGYRARCLASLTARE